MLMIADAERALAIGGVMGGEDSGVTEFTRTVLLESAYFLPSSIRRTARNLSLPSDASYRFERGVDPEMILRASARATQLLAEIAGGVAAPNTVTAGILPAPPAGFLLRYARCQQVIGAGVEPQETDRILQSFGLEKLGATEEQATWKIPSYRSDLQREIDLIEEVVRVFGINRIAGSNRSSFSAVSAADRRYDFEVKLRQRLAARGFFEVRTSALVGRDSLGSGFAAEAVELKNPLSEDHVALRPSLVPGVLGALERNLRAGAKSIRLFEIGRTFLPPEGAEARRVVLLLSGEAASRPDWRGGRGRALDLFDLKGALEALGFGPLRLERAQNANFTLAAAVFSETAQIGVAGLLASAQAARAGASAPVFLAEINLPNELETSRRAPRFEELQRFPSVTRDIALLAPETLTHEAIVASLTSGAEPLLAEVALFDLFSGKGAENIGPGRKSLAYSLTYRDKNRTLTHDEVNAAHDRIRERLRRNLAVELRE
jgi:phenylalanyl-tRNA synthetase beta chain